MFEIGKRNKPGVDRPDNAKRSLRDTPTSQQGGLLTESAPIAPPAASRTKEAPPKRVPPDESTFATQTRKDGGYISASMTVDGTLETQEDLVIDGQIRGSISALDNTVTIAARGRVEADIKAHTVVINGNFVGDVYAGELIAVRHSAFVTGNLKAPRISVEDGARLRGSVTMEDHDSDSPFLNRMQPGEQTLDMQPASFASSDQTVSTPPKDNALTGHASGDAPDRFDDQKAEGSDSKQAGDKP